MGNAFQDLQQDKESFSTLNVALFNQKDDLICILAYNQFHNILRHFDVLPNFPITRSETMADYYL